MKAKELREMTDVELNKQLKDLKAELFNLRQSSGTYVHCEASVNSFICGLATASMPIKPHTRRPAELVIVLQCSRLYLPQAATSASLKLRRLSAVRLFSSHHIR